MVGSLRFLLSAQVERHRVIRRRAFTKTAPIGSEISPGMTILSIWLLAAEKKLNGKLGLTGGVGLKEEGG